MSKSGGILGRLKPVFSLMLGARLGTGKQYFPWVSLEDEVGSDHVPAGAPGDGWTVTSRAYPSTVPT
jgi:hypothetical protein